MLEGLGCGLRVEGLGLMAKDFPARPAPLPL